MTDWLALRADVAGTRGKTYLNSCSMGLPTRTTVDQLQAYAASWEGLGAASWHDAWLDAHKAWRRAMARMLGADPDEIAWAPSVGAALGSLGSALLRQRLEGGARHELVLADLEFPAAFAALGQRPGTTTRWAASNDGAVPIEAYARQIGPATESVLASRVLYSTGAVQPTSRICSHARAAGAFSIVDDYQGLGQFRADVKEIGCDAAVGGALKWLCGGVGSAWLFVRRGRLSELAPMHYGWWANAAMFEFGKGFTPWGDARRFEGGELNVPSLLTSLSAAEQFLGIGLGRIERRTQDLGRDLRERLQDARVPHLEPTGQASAIVCLPREDAAGDVLRLRERSIIVDDRQGMLRVSPHYYNTEGENQLFVDSLVGRAVAAPGVPR